MNSYNKSSFMGNIPVVVKNLIIINVIFLLASYVLPRVFLGFRLEDLLGMHFFKADLFNPLQMVSYMFMHGGISHLFFNMFALFMLGSTLEQLWGPRKFLFYYMVTGIGAGIIQQLVWYIELQPMIASFEGAINAVGNGSSIQPYLSGIAKYFRVGNGAGLSVPALLDMKAMVLNLFVTVGASGAVFAILLAFGMIFPNAELYLMFIPIPIKAKYFVVGYGLLELYLGFANRQGDSVAHFAHLGGMLFGIILLLYWRKKGKMYNH